MDSMFTIKPLDVKDWLFLLPMIILSVSGLISLLLSTLKTPSKNYINQIVFFLGCLGALVSLRQLIGSNNHVIQQGTFFVDQFSIQFSMLLVVLVACVGMLEILKPQISAVEGEFYALLSFSLVGMIGLVSSLDLVMMFICLEIMSFASYVLIAMRRVSRDSAESSIKYFVLSGAMSAMLLMGISFIFGSVGSFSLIDVKSVIQDSANSSSHMVLMFGLLLIFASLLFKVGASPFHSWLPDVYSGASNTVATFMITAVKVTAFGFLVRMAIQFWDKNIFGEGTKMYHFLYLVAALSLAFGSFVGIRQNNLKRIFAYSSIAHTGFILMALLSLNGNVDSESYRAIFYYLVFYVIATFGAFSFLHIFKEDVFKNYELENLNGLFSRAPFVAICLTLFLLSMAGIPPTIGFFSKYYVILIAIKNGEIVLAVLAVVSSIIAAYYYIRPIVHIFFKETDTSKDLFSVNSLLRVLLLSTSSLVLLIPLFLDILR